MAINSKFEILYKKLLSEKTKERSEHVILVIAIASFIIKKNLNNHGFNDLFFSDHAGEAIALFTEHSPDVAIIDLNLGNESGIALALELIKIRPGVPVIFLSASIDPEQIEAARKVPNAVYVDRFAPFEEVIRHIKNIK